MDLNCCHLWALTVLLYELFPYYQLFPLLYQQFPLLYQLFRFWDKTCVLLWWHFLLEVLTFLLGWSGKRYLIIVHFLNEFEQNNLSLVLLIMDIRKVTPASFYYQLYMSQFRYTFHFIIFHHP